MNDIKKDNSVKKLLIPREESSLGGIDLRLRRNHRIIRIWANYKHWHVVYI